ncbi:MAG TPA: hypothetical protein VMO26_11570 [Vicinamibacterales bacterium]|nr:hypothetical protein [Vicinamibacterales bacterium]
MLAITKMFVVAVAFLFQTMDPSGHWVGLISMPEMLLQIEVDIDKKANGQLVATFGQPEQGVKGLPFSSVTIEGRTIRLVLKSGPESSIFEGVLSLDGQDLSGTATQSGMSAPFNLARKGDARIAPAPRSAPITRQLEGMWNGTIDVNGTPQRLVMTMANQSDGTSVGTVMSPDGSGVEIPIAITETANRVVVDVPSVGASFAGVLNATGSAITGTWAQGGMALPLTLRRAEP